MFITSKYNGYNRRGEQSAAGRFLILMQPKGESEKYPHYSNVCKCGKSRGEHSEIPFVPACPEHGIFARLRARANGTEEELNAICDAGERYASGCASCMAHKAYSNCLNFAPVSNSYPLRAIVRYVRLRQFGAWMMGSARIGSESVTLSGSYGSNGLPATVSDTVYESGVKLPEELYQAWARGNGWNSAGSEANAMRKWALDTFPAPKR